MRPRRARSALPSDHHQQHAAIHTPQRQRLAEAASVAKVEGEHAEAQEGRVGRPAGRRGWAESGSVHALAIGRPGLEVACEVGGRTYLLRLLRCSPASSSSMMLASASGLSPAAPVFEPPRWWRTVSRGFLPVDPSAVPLCVSPSSSISTGNVHTGVALRRL
jgi:hypothetical protein